MLSITAQRADGSLSQYTWHVGEPLPNITSNVVNFVADGDELVVIVSALRAVASQTPGVDFSRLADLVWSTSLRKSRQA